MSQHFLNQHFCILTVQQLPQSTTAGDEITTRYHTVPNRFSGTSKSQHCALWKRHNSDHEKLLLLLSDLDRQSRQIHRPFLNDKKKDHSRKRKRQRKTSSPAAVDR